MGQDDDFALDVVPAVSISIATTALAVIRNVRASQKLGFSAVFHITCLQFMLLLTRCLFNQIKSILAEISNTVVND